MRRGVSQALLSGLMVALAACTVPDWKIDGRITRYTKIERHHFQPAQLTVPAYTPFWLAIDGYDDVPTLTISSEDLGLPKRVIRAHVHVSRWPESDAPERARLAIEPLAPGRYEFMCECHGKPTTGVIVATPATSAP